MKFPKVDRFAGKYEFLSNFYPSRVLLVYGEEVETYKTVEHAYQASKTLDPKERLAIKRTLVPGKAKMLGRKVKLRDDWEVIKIPTMRLLVFRKFIYHPDLCERLMNTGNGLLVEGNYWDDTFWGVCHGEGENHLGKILMDVREEIRKGMKKKGWLRSAKER